jgi:fucose 4-O-acetylase-like acetyltransferase
MKLSKRIKKILIISFSTLYSAGLGYWLSKLFLKRHGPFGDEAHWLERYLAPIHLVAALSFLFVLGIIWERHIRVAQKLHKNRFSGWLFIFCILSLATTAVIMLYANEFLGRWAEKIHPWFGASLLPIILFHGYKKYKKLPGHNPLKLVNTQEKTHKR